MFGFLAGYRTRLGAAAMIASGIALILQAASEGNFERITEGVGLIGMGLAALGIRFAQASG